VARRPRSTDDNPTVSPQHLLSLVRSTVPPVHRAGLPFISAGLGLALVGRRYRWLRRAGLLAAGACAGFFRHPPRVPPTRPGVVVAPADGQVCLIESAAPPAELEMGDAELTRVSIFLSVFDAHVQRAPVSGEVIAVQYRPGLFGSADLPAASDSN
jgi:phosphatidylserine decarboxylase